MIVFRLAYSEFLERIRRYSFGIIFITIVMLCYSLYTGEFSFHWGIYKGVINGSWISVNFTIAAAIFFSLAGFYISKGMIQFDQSNNISPILFASRLLSWKYLLSKYISSVMYLSSLFLVFLITSIISLIAHQKLSDNEAYILISYQCVIVFPILLSAAAVALFFDSTKLLRGGAGNILYFFLWIMLISLTNKSKIISDIDLLGFTIFKYDFFQTAKAMTGEIKGFWDIALKKGSYTEVLWVLKPLEWNIVLFRLSYAVPSVCFFIMSVIAFNRYTETQRNSKLLDYSFHFQKSFEKFQRRIAKLILTLLQSFFKMIDLHQILSRPNGKHIRELLLEIKLLLKNQNIIWYIFIVWMNIWCLFSARHFDVRYVALPWLLGAPVLFWSKMGTLEYLYKTAPIIFSSIRTTKKQVLLNFFAGTFLGLIVCISVFIKAVVYEDWNLIMVTISLVVVSSSLALSFGTASKSSKLFEVFFVLFWYIGPLRAHPMYDRLFNITIAEIALLFVYSCFFSLAVLLFTVITKNLQLQRS